MFTNFSSTSFLGGSDFAYHYSSYYQDNSEMLLYYNSGKSDSIHVNGYIFGFNPDEKNSTEYIQKIIVQTYYQYVKSDLMEQ